MATDKYDLHTIDYSVQGWDAILTTDMEKLDAVIHSRILTTAGETIAQYDAIYLESDGKYDKAQADGTQQPALGLALESAVLDDEIRIQRLGPITNVGWSWATVGAKVYLDASTPGALTDIKPAKAQMIGVVLSATSIFLWIEEVYDSELRFSSSTELTVAAGVVTKTQPWHTIDTQDDDPSDEVDTINGGVDGYFLIVRAENAARTIVLKDGTGNLELGGTDITLDDTGFMVMLLYDGTLSKWVLIRASLTGGIGSVAEDLSPELGGQLQVHEFDLKLDSLLSADGKYSGITCDGVLGATLAFGDLVYLNTTDQRWELADADAEATAGDVMLAIVLAAGIDGDTRLLLLQGFIRENDWNFTSYGQALFVSSTAGDITATKPNVPGDIVRVIGYASTFADQIYFNPSGTWIEIS